MPKNKRWIRLLVSGSRSYMDYYNFHEVMNRYARNLEKHDVEIKVVIHGCANGVDTMAGAWAAAWGIPVEEYPANWKDYGRAAGPIRNRQMLTEGKPDLLIAWLEQGSRGTKNMIDQAKDFEVPTQIVRI